jgi:hypothetical protein
MRILLLIPLLFAALASGAERFTATGRNDFAILQPNEQWVYEGIEKGVKTRLTITVQAETKSINGIEARVVEAKRSAGKGAATTQRSYLAIDVTTKDVYTFADTSAQPTLTLPAKPLLGQKLGKHDEIISLTESVKVPAGSFENCLKIHDSQTRIDRLYARNVGMIQVGELKLTRHGQKKIEKPKQSVEQIDAEPIIPYKLAREALNYVGADPAADEAWLTAINDPALSAHDRSDLIEDLNENGFSDGNGRRATVDDLPLVMSRIEMIERLAPESMDEVNYEAFREAYKDLTNIANRLSQQ